MGRLGDALGARGNRAQTRPLLRWGPTTVTLRQRHQLPQGLRRGRQACHRHAPGDLPQPRLGLPHGLKGFQPRWSKSVGRHRTEESLPAFSKVKSRSERFKLTPAKCSSSDDHLDRTFQQHQPVRRYHGRRSLRFPRHQLGGAGGLHGRRLLALGNRWPHDTEYPTEYIVFLAFMNARPGSNLIYVH